MPLHCPHCRTAPAASCLMLALPAAMLLVAGCRPAGQAALPPRSQPQAPPSVPAEPTAILPAPLAAPDAGTKKGGKTKTHEDAAPLTVTLTATHGGRHIKVGTGVTLTAFTTPTRGRSATVTLFYRLNRGRKTVFSFAQGSLCSTTWMAPAPGLYRFTAAALDDRRRAAVSRSVEITVDRPATPPPRVAAALPTPAVARPSQPKSPRTAKRPAAAHPIHPPVYHVVAAHFAFSRNAVVLADALRKNGYHAVVRRMADERGKAVSVVETGTYRRPGEVFEAVAGLLRSGYPAYFFTGQ